jgi:uncharacterized protein (TIGR02145 family)
MEKVSNALYSVIIIFSFSAFICSCEKDSAQKGIRDFEGNFYPTVKIGTQEWMSENLRSVKFNDGTNIENVEGHNEWAALSTAAYCWYNNDEVNYKDTYGALYNWYAVNSGILCPTGWHIPTDEEWTILQEYLIKNGYNFDGSTTDNKYALALSSKTGWNLSDVEGAVGSLDYPNKRNTTGFNALPGGVRDANQKIFGSIGNYGMWWTSSETNYDNAWDRGLATGEISLNKGNVLKVHGFSVRCVKSKL